MENELEMENSPNPEESETSEINTDTGEQDSQKPESPPKAPPVRQDIYERMKKAETEAKQLKEQLAKVKVPQANETQNPMDVVRLAKALEGHTEDEVDFISRNATDKSIDGVIAASKDEWVRDAIDARRKKVAETNKVPAPGSASAFSTVEKSAEDLSEMLAKAKTDEERRQIHKKYWDQTKKEEQTQGI